LSDKQRTIAGVAAGACFVAITQLATRGQLTDAQLISVGCFAITMPVFACVSVSRALAMPPTPRFREVMEQMHSGATTVFLVGIAALLASFHWSIGIGFVLVSLSIAHYVVANTKADHRAVETKTESSS
jgi:hypothetical protein